jgi:hypothetical protein
MITSRCCRRKEAHRSFSPLAELLTERTAPELAYLENKFAAMISYGLTAELLAELLPTGGDINAAGVYRNVQRVGERMEAEMGEEQWQFIEGCQRDWDALPPPGPPITVGLDGGFVHAKGQKSRGEGWFKVIAGKSVPEEGAAKCFAYVQTYDPKPKRRLFELLKSQGLQANQQVTFLSDGADDVRKLPLYLSPESEHWLDWFHLTMRLTVMGQLAKGLANEQTEGLTRNGPGGNPGRSRYRQATGAGKMVSLARQRGTGAGDDRGHRRRVGSSFARGREPKEARQGRARVSRLYRSEPELHPKLWGSLPAWRDDFRGLRGVDGQPSGEQAHGKEAADAVE